MAAELDDLKNLVEPQLSHQDPDYLRWRSRHSLGLRYRQEIERLQRDESPRPAAPGRR